MKEERDKEIDLLLRRLHRRDGVAMRDAETHVDERHLDADELSSYAQNALPERARARYTEHLAECSTCRRLATELSLALGVTTAAAPVETVPAAGGLKAFLASLFSPLVLRYAVPALGVIVVMVVGFLVLRQRGGHESFVAKNDVRSEPVQMPPATPAPLDYHYDSDNQPATESPKNDASGAREAAGERPAKNEAPAGTADPAGASPVPAPVATPSGITAMAEMRPGVASSSPVTAAPKSVASLEEAETKKAAESKKDTEVKSETEAKRQPVARTAEPQAAKEKQQANEPSRSTVRPLGGATDSLARDKAQSAPSPASGTGVGGGARATTRRRAEDSREEADTRSVAGRKFRKERGIWTDTAYDSSTRTVNMARGSEQFRALVADEPAIGTIAEQLDGEVIVLWKGRAYRIR